MKEIIVKLDKYLMELNAKGFYRDQLEWTSLGAEKYFESDPLEVFAHSKVSEGNLNRPSG